MNESEDGQNGCYILGEDLKPFFETVNLQKLLITLVRNIFSD